MKAMFLTKLKLATVLLVAVGALVGGGLLAHDSWAAQPPGPSDRSGAVTPLAHDDPAPRKPDRANPGDAEQKERDKLLMRLEGTWSKVGMAHDGVPNALFANGEPYYTFRAGQFTVFNRQDQVVRRGTFKLILDEQGLDLITVEEGGKEKTQSVRFEFNGDELSLAFNVTGEKRPASLKTAPESGIHVYRFRRVDPNPKKATGWSYRLGTPNWRLGEDVRCAALSPDGRLLAAGGATRLRVFATTDGRILHDLPGFPKGIEALTFSPDGKRLLVSSLDGTLSQWDVEEGKKLATLVKGVRSVSMAAYSPDGTTIAVGVDAHPDEYLLILKADSGKELSRVEIGAHEVIFSPDGKFVATTGGFDRRAFLYDVAGRRTVCELTTGGTLVNYVAFTPDSRTLVTDPGYKEAAKERTLSLWNTVTGKNDRKLTIPNVEWTRARYSISPDGKTLYAGLVSLDLETGVRLPPTPKQFSGQAIASTPDGQLLATHHLQGGVLSVYDRKTGEEKTPGLGHRGPVTAVIPLDEREGVVTFGNDQLRAVWKPGERGYGDSTVTVATGYSAVAQATEARLVAMVSSGHDIVLYDAVSGKVRKQFKSTKFSHQGIFGLARDGAVLAVSRFQRNGSDLEAQWRIEFVSISTDTIVSTIALGENRPTALAFAPDNRTLAVASTGGKIQLFDSYTSRPHDLGSLTPAEKAQPLGLFESLAFAPDGKTIASSDKSGSVALWDVKTIKELRRFPKRFGPVQFSPDSKLLATTDESFAIRMYDPKTGEELGTYSGHTGRIQTIAFTADGKRFYSGSDDTAVLGWEVRIWK